MTTDTGPPLADTSDMVGLHRVFREALAAAPSYVGDATPGDAARADVVGSYYANVLDLLHGHHEGEDLLLTPRLLERAPEHAETITRIGHQHVDVLDSLAAAESAIAAWRADPSEDERTAALAALATLEQHLTPHLDEEEREILPIAAGCIDVAEWGQLPEHGMKEFQGDKLWLIIGLVQEQMTPEQMQNMEAHMLPPLLAQWQGPWRPMFEAFVADLRG